MRHIAIGRSNLVRLISAPSHTDREMLKRSQEEEWQSQASIAEET